VPHHYCSYYLRPSCSSGYLFWIHRLDLLHIPVHPLRRLVAGYHSRTFRDDSPFGLDNVYHSLHRAVRTLPHTSLTRLVATPTARTHTRTRGLRARLPAYAFTTCCLNALPLPHLHAFPPVVLVVDGWLTVCGSVGSTAHTAWTFTTLPVRTTHHFYASLHSYPLPPAACHLPLPPAPHFTVRANTRCRAPRFRRVTVTYPAGYTPCTGSRTARFGYTACLLTLLGCAYHDCGLQTRCYTVARLYLRVVPPFGHAGSLRSCCRATFLPPTTYHGSTFCGSRFSLGRFLRHLPRSWTVYMQFCAVTPPHTLLRLQFIPIFWFLPLRFPFPTVPLVTITHHYHTCHTVVTVLDWITGSPPPLHTRRYYLHTVLHFHAHICVTPRICHRYAGRRFTLLPPATPPIPPRYQFLPVWCGCYALFHHTLPFTLRSTHHYAFTPRTAHHYGYHCLRVCTAALLVPTYHWLHAVCTTFSRLHPRFLCLPGLFCVLRSTAWLFGLYPFVTLWLTHLRLLARSAIPDRWT